MKRTTITLPDELAMAVQREARRRAMSVSRVTREALTAHLGLGENPRQLPFANLGRSGTRDTAQRMDELMDAEWRL